MRAYACIWVLYCFHLPPNYTSVGSKGSGNNRKNQQKKKVDNGIDPSLNAVTYLTQLTQLRKENPAVYTLKADGGPLQIGVMRYQIEVNYILCDFCCQFV